jgi:hypothetical protein
LLQHIKELEVCYEEFTASWQTYATTKASLDVEENKNG